MSFLWEIIAPFRNENKTGSTANLNNNVQTTFLEALWIGGKKDKVFVVLEITWHDLNKWKYIVQLPPYRLRISIFKEYRIEQEKHLHKPSLWKMLNNGVEFAPLVNKQFKLNSIRSHSINRIREKETHWYIC